MPNKKRKINIFFFMIERYQLVFIRSFPRPNLKGFPPVICPEHATNHIFKILRHSVIRLIIYSLRINAKIQTFFQTPIFFIPPPSPAISLERKKRGRRGCLQCAGNLHLANGRFWGVLAVFVQKFCTFFHPVRHQKRHPVQGIVALVGCRWGVAGWGSA